MRDSAQLDLFTRKSGYEEFVDKFKTKKTTDDCYTPPTIYKVVLDYAVSRYGINPEKVVRPFFPEGDYRKAAYPEGCCVVDNPPFSILTQIVDFYQSQNIKFFLFAPTLTAASGKHAALINHIICHSKITYENGAVVNTSFLTNMDEDGTCMESEPFLSDAINAEDDRLRSMTTKKLPKYIYPDHVITAAKCNWFAAHGVAWKVKRNECLPIRTLDAMGGKTIFGGGFLLSSRAAAERAAAERAAAERAAAERAAAERAAAEVWELSPRELAMIAELDRLSKEKGTEAPPSIPLQACNDDGLDSRQ